MRASNVAAAYIPFIYVPQLTRKANLSNKHLESLRIWA